MKWDEKISQQKRKHTHTRTRGHRRRGENQTRFERERKKSYKCQWCVEHKCWTHNRIRVSNDVNSIGWNVMFPIETVNRIDKFAVFISSRSLSLSGWGALGSDPKRNGDDNVNFVLALTVTKKHRKHWFHQQQKRCFSRVSFRLRFLPSAPPFLCRLRPNTTDG